MVPLRHGARAQRRTEVVVWRPHRINHHAGRRPDRGAPRRDARPEGRRAPAAPQGVDAAAAEGRPTERRDDRRPQRPRPDDRGPNGRPGGDRGVERGPQQVAEAGAPQPSAGGGAEGQSRAPRPGRDVGSPARSGKARFEGRGGENRGGARGEGRGGSRDGGRGPQTFTTEAPRPAPRDRQPDPNSPFAKLMALKVELERGKKES